MLQAMEEFRDEDEINELKYKVERKLRVTHWLREAHEGLRAVLDTDPEHRRLSSEIEWCAITKALVHCVDEFRWMKLGETTSLKNVRVSYVELDISIDD